MGLTVEQLIEKLQKLPQGLEVWMGGFEGCETAFDVEFYPGEDRVYILGEVLR